MVELYNIPSIDDANQLTQAKECFITKDNIVGGALVHQFSYMLAMPADFRINKFAKELRGICYVEIGTGWKKPYPMLHKFHNINECDGYMMSDVKDIPISSIQVKEDGSLIRFIKINGEWYAKTKYAFESPQAQMANQILAENDNLRQMLDDYSGFHFMFELISPFNRIVVEYEQTELRVIQIRRANGSYMCEQDVIDICEQYDVCHAEYVLKDIRSIDELIEYSQSVSGEEGWIVRLENEKFIKVKTPWYIERHRLLTGDGIIAHNLIPVILDDKIDDLLAELNLKEDDERKLYIDEVIEVTAHYFNHLVHYINDVLKDFTADGAKEFALKHKNDKYFTLIMSCARLEQDKRQEVIKNFILKHTRRKEMAERFVKNKEV